MPRTHGHLRAEADAYAAAIGLTADDTVFCTIPLFHTYGMGCCLLAAVRSGATLVLFHDPNPFVLQRGRALELLERERATVFPAVPFTFRLLAEAPEDADLSALRLCFSAAAALPRSTFNAFRERFGIPIRQLYGCTEAGAVTVNLDEDPYETSRLVRAPDRGRRAARRRRGGRAARARPDRRDPDPQHRDDAAATPGPTTSTARPSATAGSGPAIAGASTRRAGCSSPAGASC